jgi:glycosyltransferase involved in cell wall biosynthesis
MDKPKLLWLGDSPIKSPKDLTPPSGFGRVSHELIGRLSKLYDITVYALNFECDNAVKSTYCEIIPSFDPTNNDPYGYKALDQRVDLDKFDKVVIFNDLWIINYYLHFCPKLLEKKLYFYFPVDSEGYSKPLISNLSKAHKIATYTNFGVDVIEQAGWDGDVEVVPHGNSECFYPTDKKQAREAIFKDYIPEDAFIVFSANRNTERKRLDILVKAFVEFAVTVKEQKGERIPYLYLHCGFKDVGFWVQELYSRECQLRGVKLEGQLLLPAVELDDSGTPKISFLHPQIDNEILNLFYNAVDVNVNVSTGEGWGLTSTESASVGCPQIYTDFAALGELFDNHSGYPVEPTLMLTDPALNLERAYVDPEDVACALCEVYGDPEIAEIKAIKAKDYLSQFTWEFAVKKFIKWLEN